MSTFTTHARTWLLVAGLTALLLAMSWSHSSARA